MSRVEKHDFINMLIQFTIIHSPQWGSVNPIAVLRTNIFRFSGRTAATGLHTPVHRGQLISVQFSTLLISGRPLSPLHHPFKVAAARSPMRKGWWHPSCVFVCALIQFKWDFITSGQFKCMTSCVCVLPSAHPLQTERRRHGENCVVACVHFNCRGTWPTTRTRVLLRVQKRSRVECKLFVFVVVYERMRHYGMANWYNYCVDLRRLGHGEQTVPSIRRYLRNVVLWVMFPHGSVGWEWWACMSICGGFVCNDKYYVCDGLLTVGIQRSCPYSFADKGFVELV